MYYVVAGQHPAFGYVDQPPLTPLLSAGVGRPAGCHADRGRGCCRRRDGARRRSSWRSSAGTSAGPRRAQVLAACTAALSGYLGAGHLDTTTDPDLLAWAIIVWLLVRLLDGGDPRLWLVVGVVAGIALENKDTVLFLGRGAGRRVSSSPGAGTSSRCPWAWAALGIALLLWAPNLVWQATNGWPQLTMASRIAGYAADNRAQVVPLLWLFTGPLLFPVSVRRSGLGPAARRRPRPWRAIGIAGAWWRWPSSSSAAARPTTRSGAPLCSWPPARSSSTGG